MCVECGEHLRCTATAFAADEPSVCRLSLFSWLDYTVIVCVLLWDSKGTGETKQRWEAADDTTLLHTGAQQPMGLRCHHWRGGGGDAGRRKQREVLPPPLLSSHIAL
jgi:hypothetical protein